MGREIEEVTKQLEEEKTEINRVLEQELGAYIKTRLEKEHFADIWSSTDCHGEEQKAETVFLAKVVTAKTRLRFPFLKKFKFSSQVYIYKDFNQDFCIEVDGVWDKRISNVLSAKVSVSGFKCLIVSFLVPFTNSSQQGPSDDDLKKFIYLADSQNTEHEADSDSDSSSSSSEGGTSYESSTSTSSEKGSDSDSSTSGTERETCQKKPRKRSGTQKLKRREDPAPVELRKRGRKKL